MSYYDDTIRCGLKVGDKVRVTSKAKDHENGWDNCWVPEMDDCIGKTYTITRADFGSGFHLEDESGKDTFRFPYFVLKLANGKAEVKPKSNDYPHVCPRCGAPAYCGLFKVDCSRGCQ